MLHCHCVVLHHCCVVLCHCCVVAVLLLLLHCCSHCMVNTGVLDRGQVQVGHIVSPGMLQPLLVSAGDEEQVECTYLLENTDGRMDGRVRTRKQSEPSSPSSSLSDRGG